MTISDLKHIITRSQAYLERGDAVQVGRYVGYVTDWQRQPEWCDHEWNIQVWVPKLARHIWQRHDEITMAEAA